MNAGICFSQDYREARDKFLHSASRTGGVLQTHLHPLRGRDGEDLAIDVVRLGRGAGNRMLLITSGCHGVEGFCGSAIQTSLLQSSAWLETVDRLAVDVLLVHSLNPFGFSWLHRTNEDHVDLNRNFRDFSKAAPENQEYAQIAHLAVPATWPPDRATRSRIEEFIFRRGLRAWQAALTRGQYQFRDGLFYGGEEPSWSHLALRSAMRTNMAGVGVLGWIDIHSGLGPAGHGERIFACHNEPRALATARKWWGQQVTSIFEGTSESAELVGEIYELPYEELPGAQYVGVTLEFGTQPIDIVLDALRADAWLASHPEASAELRDDIRRRLRDAFYVDSPEWKSEILRQGWEVAMQGLAGLAGECIDGDQKPRLMPSAT